MRHAQHVENDTHSMRCNSEKKSVSLFFIVGFSSCAKCPWIDICVCVCVCMRCVSVFLFCTRRIYAIRMKACAYHSYIELRFIDTGFAYKPHAKSIFVTFFCHGIRSLFFPLRFFAAFALVSDSIELYENN